MVATHDRELLQQVERILELDQHGLNEYGGNYAIYHTIRDAQVAATEQQMATLKRNRQQQNLNHKAALEK